MPSKKRARLESSSQSEDEADVLPDSLVGLTTKRTSALRRSGGKSPEKGRTCPKGHSLELASSFSRRQRSEAALDWSCDKCFKAVYDGITPRHRCDRCDYDLCGDCFSARDQDNVRRSSREPKPNFNSGTWIMSPKKLSPTKMTNGVDKNYSHKSRQREDTPPKSRSAKEDSPPTSRSRQEDSSPKTSRSRQEDASPRTTRSRQDEASPRNTKSRQEELSPKRTRTRQEDGSPGRETRRSRNGQEDRSPSERETRRSRSGQEDRSQDRSQDRSPSGRETRRSRIDQEERSPSAREANRSRSSQEERSPSGRETRRSRSGKNESPHIRETSRSQSPKESRTTRSHPSPATPERRASRSHPSSLLPATAVGKSPRKASSDAASKIMAQGFDADSMEEGDREEGGREDEEDSPFYSGPPQHVRFSPSAKTSSPYGRKTRSKDAEGMRKTRRGYLQGLPSEDEQSEFNRQYSRDLRKRQQRKNSNEEELGTRRSSRVRNDSQSDAEAPITEVSRESRKRDDSRSEDVEPRRSSRRRNDSQSEGEAPPRPSRRRIDSQSEGEAPSRPSRRRNDSQAEDDTQPSERRHSLRRKVVRALVSDSEGEELVKPRKGRPKKSEETEDEDEEDNTVTESSARRSSRIKTRNVLDGDEGDTESAEEKETEEGETEEEDETEDDDANRDGPRRSSRRTKAPPERLQYKEKEKPAIRRSGSNEVRNMDKYSTDDEYQAETSERKKKYSLRENAKKTKMYQVEQEEGRRPANSKERGLIRRSSENRNERSNRRMPVRASGSRSNKDRSHRPRTGDSSSPTDSCSSDEETFDKRKKKRMAIEREKLRPLNMGKSDLNKAIFKDRAKVGSSMADVQPMEMDMGVTFDSVGGLKSHVDSLKEMVMFPLLYPEVFSQFNITPPRGVLFYGPPGTGKTLLARALACECSTENRKVAFFMRKGADCLSKWIGESERQLRLLFDQAYAMRPSIIFFDEIDGLAPVRSSRQDQIHSSIVSTLLALMDGLDHRGEIIVIGATNRIENIDPALRRPGRFDRELRFDLPSRATRKAILKLYVRDWKPPITDTLVNTLATRTIGYCGADIKGLTAEAALNALRRRYPQIYTSNQKLALDLNEIQILRCDFEKAMRTVVPSTHRVTDKVLAPLPKHIRPLLEATYTNIVADIKRIFPHCSAAKGTVLPSTLTHRPRLLLVSNQGQGQTTYIGPAILHFMEKLPVQKLDIPALFSNSARTPEEACTQIFHSARRTMPGVLYIPHLCTLWETISDTVRATLLTLLTDIPPTAPLLLLAIADTGYHKLPQELQTMFIAFYKEVYKIENPSENERREFFRPLIVSTSTQPKVKVARAPVVLEELPVVAAPESRKLTAREEKRLKRKEEALLRELRIFLRDIWNKINKESKFFMFRFPIDTEEVYDYLETVKQPMDFEKMHMKLDDGEYQCAQQFLDDIDLIAENAISYNCDVAYETNRIICHRARALQDFCYALVKAEMDTDFEEECKDIVERREAATKKLKELDKASKKAEKQSKIPESPSKMQDMLAITRTACEVCSSRDDEDSMLLCDGCDAGYHTFCCTPQIEEVPEGDWFCVNCNDELGLKEGGTVSESERGTPGSGKKKKKRRKNKWASGSLGNSKKKTKKRDSQDGTSDKANEKDADETEKEDKNDDEENEDKEKEKEEESEKEAEPNDMEVDEADSADAGPSVMSPGTPPDSNSLENSLAPTNLRSALQAQIEEDEPSQPTGVRIDSTKMAVFHTDLVRATDGFTVERLERVYTILAKVVRTYQASTDRTNLPADLAAELDSIRQQDRISEHSLHRR